MAVCIRFQFGVAVVDLVLYGRLKTLALILAAVSPGMNCTSWKSFLRSKTAAATAGDTQPVLGSKLVCSFYISNPGHARLSYLLCQSSVAYYVLRDTSINAERLAEMGRS